MILLQFPTMEPDKKKEKTDKTLAAMVAASFLPLETIIEDIWKAIKSVFSDLS